MSKHKSSKPEENKGRQKQSIPDNGQGSSGDLGSEADVGKDSNSIEDKKSKKGTQSSPVPVKRKERTVSDS